MNNMSDQHVDMLCGYQPERLALSRSIAESLAKSVDIHRVGPGVTLPQVRDLSQFTSTQPLDKASQARVVIIDLDNTRRNVQTALLRTLEEPASNIKYIIIVAEEDTVLETIRSRCNVTRCRPPSYANVIKDLASSGLSMSAAAKSATGIMSGYDLSSLPDDQAVMRATSMLEEVQGGHIASALRLSLDFEAKDVEALRQQLLSVGAIRLVEATYESTDPPNAAMRVVIAANTKK
jgi:hypothetical protein